MVSMNYSTETEMTLKQFWRRWPTGSQVYITAAGSRLWGLLEQISGRQSSWQGTDDEVAASGGSLPVCAAKWPTDATGRHRWWSARYDGVSPCSALNVIRHKLNQRYVYTSTDFTDFGIFLRMFLLLIRLVLFVNFLFWLRAVLLRRCAQLLSVELVNM